MFCVVPGEKIEKKKNQKIEILFLSIKIKGKQVRISKKMIEGINKLLAKLLDNKILGILLILNIYRNSEKAETDA